jgi:glutaconate CoA-transferase subunit A
VVNRRLALTTLESAVAGIAGGDVVYIGNFGAQLFSVGHELIRQQKRGLHIIAPSGGILVDELIAEGVTASITVSHCWNPVGPAPTMNFRDAVEGGSLPVRELSFGTLCDALAAAAGGHPFMPTTDLGGTGYLTEGRTGGLVRELETPFGRVIVVAAISPDVAFLHVDHATTDGDGWLRHPVADAKVAAQAAHRTVLVTEEIVAGGPSVADIPSLLVSAVVHHPGGVMPDGAAGRYPRDIARYQGYAAVGRDRGLLASWRDAVDEGVRQHA